MSAYLGAAGLLRLREQLTPRDVAILNSVREHRFLTGRQIEQLHFDGHASGPTGGRVCRRVLARLTRDRLLRRLDRKVGRSPGSDPYTYTLGPVGDRATSSPGQPRRLFKEPSQLFLTHTLALADTRLALEQAHRAHQIRIVSIEVEPRSWREFLGAGGARERVRPDLHLITTDNTNGGSGFEDLWFLEVDRSTESVPVIVRKCRLYERFRRTGAEQHRNGGTFPLVVFACPDSARATRIDRAIRATNDIPNELFRACTNAGLVELIAAGAA